LWCQVKKIRKRETAHKDLAWRFASMQLNFNRTPNSTQQLVRRLLYHEFIGRETFTSYPAGCLTTFLRPFLF